jgi:hypothetical protein
MKQKTLIEIPPYYIDTLSRAIYNSIIICECLGRSILLYRATQTTIEMHSEFFRRSKDSIQIQMAKRDQLIQIIIVVLKKRPPSLYNSLAI